MKVNYVYMYSIHIHKLSRGKNTFLSEKRCILKHYNKIVFKDAKRLLLLLLKM